MPMSDFLESAILELVLNNGTYTPAASVWVALFTSSPTDANTGTEVSGFGYARVQVTNGFTLTGQATRASNAAAVVFPVATGSWGTVTDIGIFNGPTAGDLLFHGTLDTPRPVVNGDTFQIVADSLGITLG